MVVCRNKRNSDAKDRPLNFHTYSNLLPYQMISNGYPILGGTCRDFTNRIEYFSSPELFMLYELLLQIQNSEYNIRVKSYIYIYI